MKSCSGVYSYLTLNTKGLGIGIGGGCIEGLSFCCCCCCFKCILDDHNFAKYARESILMNASVLWIGKSLL